VSRWVALDSDVTAFDTEDNTTGVFHFENGAALSFDVSWAINLEDVDTTVVSGSLAGAKLACVDGFSRSNVTIYTESDGYLTDNTPKFLETNPFEQEIDYFLRCVRSGEAPDASLADGLTMIRMLMGIYQSAKEGREVAL